MEYKIIITETLQRTVSVIADDEDDAMEQVKNMYNNGDIVLDSEDYVDTEFS